MNVPQRHQRSRKAGEKQPASCKYVGRGTKYGNDYKIVTGYGVDFGYKMIYDEKCIFVENEITHYLSLPMKDTEAAHAHAVIMFDVQLQINIGGNPAYYDDLLNYEYISCFCPLDMPCHCDTIIEHLKERIKVLA